jgi:hypothetical protein
MSCVNCGSGNHEEFPAEVNIHFAKLRNVDKPGVFVFPRLLVCLDCGASSFMTPESELNRLRLSDKLLADSTAIAGSNSPAAWLLET